MEQDLQQSLETTRAALDVAQKTGLLGRMASWIQHRRSQGESAGPIDYREEALKAALENAVETIRVQEFTVEQALQILGPDFSLDDLGRVDPTWQRHWAESTSKVGVDADERRTWWARLLAGEIQQPGTFSLRTMAVMDTLSTREAELFARLCDYVWNPMDPTLIIPSEESTLWKPDFGEMDAMESAGLIRSNGTGYSISPRGAPDGATPMGMAFGNSFLQITSAGGTELSIPLGKLHLTYVGVEMYKLTTPNYPVPYRDEIISEWRQSYEVSGPFPIGSP